MKNFVSRLQKQSLPLCLLATSVLAAGTSALAATTAPATRIRAEVSTSSMSRLPGTLSPLAQAQNDRGRLQGATRMEGITLFFSRTATQQKDLDTLIKSQTNPKSPQFHKWLTPEQFGARFGLADADIAKVQAWLESQGFAVDSIGRSRTMVRFSGSASQVESAFNTELHSYTVNSEKHFAPATALSVPSALSGVVIGARNLDDFRPKPQVRLKTLTKPVASFTGSTSSGTEHYLAPGDITTIYNVKPLQNAGYTGVGQSIAILGQSDVNLQDVAKFRTAAGVGAKAPTKILYPGSGAPYFSAGDQSESDLDLEWSGSIAPQADIFFVYTGDNPNYSVFDSAIYAIDNYIAPIISVSYGLCEAGLSQASFDSLEGFFQQASAQGQTLLAASGDAGATACYSSSSGSGGTSLAVSYPASSQYFTAVGGTEFNEGSGSYWNSSNASDNSSATSYIPEVVWNDDSASGLSSTGGGVSGLYIGKPYWQAGVPGIPNDAARDLPDISLDASNDHDGYLYCSSDITTWASAQVGTCTSGFLDGGGYATIAGGTSFSTPILAGMLALINQRQNSTGQGLINPTLYGLAAVAANYAASSGAFHDVTSGTNACGSKCPSGVSATTGYAAGAYYDQATGLGTIDLNNLASIWPVAAPGTEPSYQSSVTTVTTSSSPVALGTAITFTATVSPGSATGTITFTLDGVSSTPVALVNGKATSTAVTYSTASSAGNHIMVATYSGDPIYAVSTGTASVDVLSSSGSFTLSPADSTVTLSSSTSCTVGNTTYSAACEDIKVTPTGSYAGTVDLNIYTSSVKLSNSACWTFLGTTNQTVASVPISGGTAGTATIVISNSSSFCNSYGNVIGGSFLPTHHFKLANSPSTPSQSPTKAGIWFGAMLLAGLVGLRFRKVRSLGFLALLLATMGFGMTACGGSGSSSGGGGGGGGSTGTSYSVTIVGNDTVSPSLTATSTINVTIK